MALWERDPGLKKLKRTLRAISWPFQALWSLVFFRLGPKVFFAGGLEIAYVQCACWHWHILELEEHRRMSQRD